MKNYVEIRFENPVLAEILDISKNGKFDLKLDTVEPAKSPKNVEDVISMLFSLLEKNPDTPESRVYMGNQADILRRTVLGLSDIVNAFGDIEVVITYTEKAPDGSETETRAVTNITVSALTEN
ncbi:MAG: hypothetical protein K2K14_02520 [Ruminococcus sp.]|nr:hypothetical protein [Ruminococcus sp.]